MAGVTTPVTKPDTYANKDDLTSYWKAPDDANRADYILKLVSNRLRQIGSGVGVDVDAQVNSDEVYFLNVQWVVMEATKRALLAPTDREAVESSTLTAGPYSENYKYSNPAGDIFFKKSELQTLGLYGRQTLSSLNTSQNLYYDIYSS